MQRWNHTQVTHALLTLAILLSGVALIPFVGIPAEAISWENLAGVYAPELSVNANSGAPGSVFAFTGSGYPANEVATVFVDGQALGTVLTDGSGMARFKLNTAGVPLGQYNVTLEVDVNASATQSITLVADGAQVLPPPGFEGPTFNLGQLIYLPIISKQ